MKNFEMAHADNPEEIIKATQKSLVLVLKDVVSYFKRESKAPGLTWAQIEYLLKLVEEKQPTIITQEGEM